MGVYVLIVKKIYGGSFIKITAKNTQGFFILKYYTIMDLKYSFIILILKKCKDLQIGNNGE